MSLLDSETARQIYDGIRTRDVSRVRQLLTDNPEFRDIATFLRPSWLHDAAAEGDIPMLAMLLKLGLDINKIDRPAETSPLISAINKGRLEAVGFLLESGADPTLGRALICAINYEDDDVALTMVKQLVENGADYDQAYPFGDEDGPLFNAFTWAEDNEKEGIVAYLRAKGATSTPHPQARQPADDPSADVVAYFSQSFGPVKPLAQHEIVPSGIPIAIHVIPAARQRKVITLFTSGMSAAPLNAPRGKEAYRYAELMMHLPPRWPLSRDALLDPQHAWPFQWLRKIARYPHETNSWLGAPICIIENGEPPDRLAPNVDFTAIMLAAKDQIQCRDGRIVQVYVLVPLYRQEVELERAHGLPALMQAFDRHGISDLVDLRRANAAK